METHYPVVFVGGGPGDPELITVRGRRALEEADLVLYAGSLVQQAMLKWTRPGTLHRNTASMTLEKILDAMASAYRQGKRVVRLHTGDLSLYSAVQEQVDGLDALGIPYRMVPGVTAAFAVSAALGREFTVPEITQTLILTRAAGRTPVPEREGLGALARHGATMAVYLSASQAEAVAAELIPSYGPDAPVVIAYRVTWPDERILRATLSTLAERIRTEGITRHALIVVGPALSDSKEAQTRSKLYNGTFSHGFRSGTSD